jgi:hypothetical protein
LVDAATGGNVVVVVLVVGVLGRAPFPVSVCVRGPCEPEGTEVEVEDDAFPDDGIMGMAGAVPVTGNGVGVL